MKECIYQIQYNFSAVYKTLQTKKKIQTERIIAVFSICCDVFRKFSQVITIKLLANLSVPAFI